MRRKIEITPGRAHKLNARARRLTGDNGPQAAAELAELMRAYKVRRWAGRSLAGLDIQANTAVYVSDVTLEGAHWIGESDDLAKRMSHYATAQRVIALYTPSLAQALIYRSQRRTSAPSASALTRGDYIHPFSYNFGNSLEVHNHRLPFTKLATTQTWQGCCANPRFRPLESFKDLVWMVGSGDPLTKIANWMFLQWRDLFGPATLVSLSRRG